MRPRDFLRCRPGLPDTQKPNPVEAGLHKPLQIAIGNIVECCWAMQRLGKLGEPDASIDLVKRRKHGAPPYRIQVLGFEQGSLFLSALPRLAEMLSSAGVPSSAEAGWIHAEQGITHGNILDRQP